MFNMGGHNGEYVCCLHNLVYTFFYCTIGFWRGPRPHDSQYSRPEMPFVSFSPGVFRPAPGLPHHSHIPMAERHLPGSRNALLCVQQCTAYISYIFVPENTDYVLDSQLGHASQTGGSTSVCCSDGRKVHAHKSQTSWLGCISGPQQRWDSRIWYQTTRK